MKSKIVVFSQQPADVAYVLTLYEKFHGNFNFIIVCTNVESNYRFYLSLELTNTEIFFLPYLYEPTIRKPWMYLLLQRYIRGFSARLIFENVHKVVFFAKGHDWLGHFLIDIYLKKNVQIEYFPVVSFSIRPLKITFIQQIHLSLMRSVLGLRLSYVNLGHAFCLYYDNPKILEIEIPLNPEVYKKFVYKPIISTNNSILLIDDNLENYEGIIGYRERLLGILIDYKLKGFDIFIKPHPRTGVTAGLEELNGIILDRYIPLEFIDVTEFRFVIGIMSLSMANLTKMGYYNIYVLINEFTWQDKSKKESLIKLLRDNTKGELKFYNPLKPVI